VGFWDPSINTQPGRGKRAKSATQRTELNLRCQNEELKITPGGEEETKDHACDNLLYGSGSDSCNNPDLRDFFLDGSSFFSEVE
jgi:hypothetical protein